MGSGFAITFGGGLFVSDLAENRSETASDLSENRSETKVGDTRPGQDTKENVLIPRVFNHDAFGASLDSNFISRLASSRDTRRC